MSIDQIERGSVGECPRSASGKEHFRVICWNIARGIHFDAICEFLSRSNADLILLQEVDAHCRRTHYRNIAEDLSNHLRMNYVFGSEFQELAQGERDSPAYHGQATLSPWPLLEARVLRFQNQSKFWAPSLWAPALPFFQRRTGGRMALVTDVCLGSMRMTTYNLHLESRNGDQFRCSQLLELLKDTRRYEAMSPVILAGDFNFDLRTGCQSLALLESEFTNPFSTRSHATTTPAIGRAKPLDWIMVRGALQVSSPITHRHVDASDHLPLSLTVRLV